ncbi:MAG: flagellar hook capping FlgD N-terminal domain-containing protein [Caldicoprobacter sp.]|uniref:flagellar hook capping FlgD N-terminal domain-containing protein n=1 Tax=Caldicoprobacter sp. TaxID=2004500 RepID=UPI001DF189DB|nr:flagellar hook capping protein [Clostridia bacterium]
MYVSSVNSQAYTVKNSKQSDNHLGKDAFLKLLVTQLKYQDPLNPMEDREFIAQLAQFSTLELMQNLSNDFTSLKAMGLLDKIVYAEKRSENSGWVTPVYGRVEGVSMVNGKVILHVNGNDVALDDVKEIYSETVDKQGDK